MKRITTLVSRRCARFTPLLYVLASLAITALPACALILWAIA